MVLINLEILNKLRDILIELCFRYTEIMTMITTVIRRIVFTELTP